MHECGSWFEGAVLHVREVAQARGHTASTVGKQSEVNAGAQLAFLLTQSRTPPMGWSHHPGSWAM